jgi:hypothetical protein
VPKPDFTDQRNYPALRSVLRAVAVRLMSRETTSATYMMPANHSSITSAHAIGVTGTMSLSPTLESTATLR